MYELIIISLITGYILDLIIGDPRCIPHPICFIGKVISKGEKTVRKIFPQSENMLVWAGMCLSIFTVILCTAIPFIILYLVQKSAEMYIGMEAGKIAFVVVSSFMCFQILATKSLKTETMKVYDALKSKNINKSRYAISMIVGRDTDNLNEKDITKACVETISENTSDGVIAPMFYFLIGGAPLAFAYKAVNTLDSMIGYKNDKYIYFGRFAAKLDDVANFIPARITGILTIVSSLFLKYDFKNGVKIFLRDRKKHSSPNSAQCESACAGVLNIQLAGPSNYFGVRYEKPYIGDDIREIEKEDIIRANKILYVVSAIPVIFTIIVGISIYFI